MITEVGSERDSRGFCAEGSRGCGKVRPAAFAERPGAKAP